MPFNEPISLDNPSGHIAASPPISMTSPQQEGGKAV